MTRDRTPGAIASAAVALLVVALGYGVVAAIDGAHLLVVAPAIGMVVGLGVWAALRRVRATGSRAAETALLAGIALMAGLGVLGVSLGGFTILIPTALLTVAYALTPRLPRNG